MLLQLMFVKRCSVTCALLTTVWRRWEGQGHQHSFLRMSVGKSPVVLVSRWGSSNLIYKNEGLEDMPCDFYLFCLQQKCHEIEFRPSSGSQDNRLSVSSTIRIFTCTKDQSDLSLRKQMSIHFTWS